MQKLQLLLERKRGNRSRRGEGGGRGGDGGPLLLSQEGYLYFLNSLSVPMKQDFLGKCLPFKDIF